MQNVELDKNDITNDIKNKSMNETWIIIGGKKKWIRKCTVCNDNIYHTTLNQRNNSEKLNTQCRRCYYKKLRRNKRIITSEDLIRCCPKCNKPIIHSTIWNKQKYDKKKSPCRECYWKNFQINVISNGRKTSDETKEKIRKSIIRKLEERGSIYFNPKACEYFNKLNKEKEWELQHAKNGGEIFILGAKYKVDAYDKERNIVVEYDEPHHYFINGELKPRDIKRMNEIIEHLKCKFYRYDEKRKILKEHKL